MQSKRKLDIRLISPEIQGIIPEKIITINQAHRRMAAIIALAAMNVLSCGQGSENGAGGAQSTSTNVPGTGGKQESSNTTYVSGTGGTWESTSSSSTGGEGGSTGGEGGSATGGESGSSHPNFIYGNCYWGPEPNSPILRQQLRNADNGQKGLKVCKCEGEFNDENVDVSLWSYMPGKNKQMVKSWEKVHADGECTDEVFINANDVPYEFIESRIVIPSGPSYDECANEQQCPEVGMGGLDNTFRTGADYTPLEGFNQCYWGPEPDSPVLQEALRLTSDGRLGISVCKCTDLLNKGKIDLQLWSYDGKEKKHIKTWPNLALKSGFTICAPEVFVNLSEVKSGTWLKTLLVSPAGSIEDNCANENQCSSNMPSQDKIYSTGAVRVPEF